MCRSRRELSNEYLLAKIGVDSAENEPLKFWGNYSILFIRVLRRDPHRGPRVRAGRARGTCCADFVGVERAVLMTGDGEGRWAR